MDFFRIQSQTSLNIDLFVKNYLARTLKICGSWSGYRHFSKNSNRRTKTAIYELILSQMISKKMVHLL